MTQEYRVVVENHQQLWFYVEANSRDDAELQTAHLAPSDASQIFSNKFDVVAVEEVY